VADRPAISIVVPVHDEEESIEPLHAELDAALRGLGEGVEILLVDDGSRDGSLAKMREVARATRACV
jgi:glycosyltransferase involved in cell wall biosynthesis